MSKDALVAIFKSFTNFVYACNVLAYPINT